MRKKITPVFLPKRPGDVFKTSADLSRVKKILGFRPKINFTQGLELTVDWFKENA
jgi:nucleoside-diphosphate-sugar epimerase